MNGFSGFDHPAFAVVAVAAVLAISFAGSAALAVRPFVTDDARIIDYGQFEAETWLELGRSEGSWDPAPALNVMAGVSVTEWLEIIAGSGLGRGGDDEFTVVNPLIQPKLLLIPAHEGGLPGLAFGAGFTFDAGRGTQHDRGRGAYYIAMSTLRLRDDWLMIHGNLGVRSDRARGGSTSTRAYWGLGLDLAMWNPDFRFILESYAGDPLELGAPRAAGQLGFRWIKSDYVNFDMTFGMQPQNGSGGRRHASVEGWGQLGIRLLLDVFTRDGKPGRFDGASGLFPNLAAR